MAQWTAFAGLTVVVLVLLLVLSHLTQTSFSSSSDADAPAGDTTGTDNGLEAFDAPRATRDGDADEFGERSSPATDESDAGTRHDRHDRAGADHGDSNGDGKVDTLENAEPPTGDDGSSSRDDRAIRTDDGRPGHAELDPDDLSTGLLLANVAASQGLFLIVLLGAILFTAIPANALGIEFSLAYLASGLAVGTGAGIVLYAANELGAAFAERVGFDHDEQLRSMLAPDSTGGWLTLLLVVLPIIAAFEELLFRGALIGVFATGFDASPWLLAVVSSVAFALGHGMQGSVGVAVTGALGFVLAAVFIATGSLLVVVVAHYLINALEFVVHEGLELEWATRRSVSDRGSD
ncbi:CPBP family intramembrane glutamic endopeptidase [Natrialba asiatica]|uniref:Abortive infection protein n=1 Tax=Natrialba asiatica (strain ATCC 700177 / DSM 12278 / JCM 9576 / FERM P-10747 / NBRC 102637 / 172P1) TaxID=29540 RepID=M0ALM7_NATA1|nr:type II CAAX endopeptidase family protein [Natrialba asiatica]ELY98822.1 Abortive infection protein [Natrialba asiatica DSM 12278]